MQVEDKIENTFFVPNIIADKITFILMCELSEREILLFNKALTAVANGIKKDNIDEPRHTNVIFTKNGSFYFSQEKDSIFAMHCNFCIYAMETLRKTENDYFILVTFIEELVHHFWGIEDEVAVKYKVVDVAQTIEPKVTVDMLKGWGLKI